MSNLKVREPLTWGIASKRLIKLLAVAAVIGLPLLYMQGRYKVVFDNVKGANCLPYSVFLIDLRDRNVTRGDYVAFAAEQMEPFYKKGTPAVKIMAGVPGDHVAVTEQGIAINGKHWGPLTHVQRGEKLREMGRRLEEFLRDEEIPIGQFAMLGTYERSYDSRYWGYIRHDQIIGRAVPLW